MVTSHPESTATIEHPPELLTVTNRPELELGLTLNVVPNSCVDGAVKVIVWLACPMVIVLVSDAGP
jgi:hypothetical protein